MDHKVSGVKDQRGPVARCAATGCEARPVQWNVMADEWQHVYTVAAYRAAQAAQAESIIGMMRGLAGALYPLRHGAETPDQVERYLRS